MLEPSNVLERYGVCQKCEDEYAVAGILFQVETKAPIRVCEECALELLESGLYAQELIEDSLDIEEVDSVR